MNRFIWVSLCCIFVSLLLLQPAAAQRKSPLSAEAAAQLHQAEDTLALLAYAIINDSFPENRYAACRSLITGLVRNLKTPNSFDYPFARMRSVSIQYPADSSFRIFTWQLYVNENEYRYYGAIQLNTPDLQLFPLIDRSADLTPDTDLEQLVLPADRWYGSVYYNLLSHTDSQGPYYLLFGFDGFSFFRKRKVIDVLRFVDGKPQFGAPVFVQPQPGRQPALTKNRLVLEYSAESSVRCNYDPALGFIIYDHLTALGGEYNQGMVMVPDGTYEAYELKNGLWHYVEQLANTPLDDAPVPQPVLQGRKTDILGRN